MSTSSAVTVRCSENRFPRFQYAYIMAPECGIYDAWHDFSQEAMKQSAFSSTRHVTIAMADVPTFKTQKHGCSGSWTMEVNHVCSGTLLLLRVFDVLDVAKPGILQPRERRSFEFFLRLGRFGSWAPKLALRA